MKRICIIGHFAINKDIHNGQTIKTKVIADALAKHFGLSETLIEDTHGKWKFLLRLPIIIIRSLSRSKHVIIMPAYKGIFFIAPLLYLTNLLFKRHLHYVVIGGWLPSYTQRYALLRYTLRHYHHIYVETASMKHHLDTQGFSNVIVMPNCKPLDILHPQYLPTLSTPPYKLCIFSRIIKEKGIEDAINAVKQSNNYFKRTVYLLDIYGQIEQKEWFNQIMGTQPKEISYKGIVPYNKSTEILYTYFALLFPTYYRGEAFAGTLIDAMAAGLPTIASDWHANPELVKEGVTGFLFPTHSVEALTQLLIQYAQHPDKIQSLRLSCLRKAHQYLPETALTPLFNNLNQL